MGTLNIIKNLKKIVFMLGIAICIISSNSFGQVSLLPYSNVAATVNTCDDCYQQVNITGVFSSGINFGGTIYNDMYIGSNGYVTFGHGNTGYSPLGIAGYITGPIIAGQYDDLDVIKGGTIYYDENAGSGYIVVTFNNVAPFSSPPVYGSGGTTFQIVLRKLGTYSAATPDFQIEVRYNNIGWWQSGNVGSPPTAGWSTGTGTTYGEMPYSGSTSFGSNQTSSNVGTNGLYQWDVTGGSVLSAPTVNQTSGATSITGVSATSGGNISSDGGASITQHGVVWSTSTFPTLSSHPGGSYTSQGAAVTGSFSSSVSGLSMGTTYYVRAYATNSEGTGYGPQINFTTLSNSPPTVNNESYFVYARTARSVSTPTLLSNDSDPDGDGINITNTGTHTTSLGGSVTIASNGTFSYTAPTNQSAGANDSFTYTVSDGQVSTNGTCTINLVDAIYNGTNTNITAGNWNAGYVPPLDSDMDVIFQSGVVTITSSMIVRNLTIYNAASFLCSGSATITIHGNIGNENRVGVSTSSPIIFNSGFKVHD